MAEGNSLTAERRERSGTGGARATRREGRVPAILYGDDPTGYLWLATSEAQFHAIVRSSDDAIFSEDADGRATSYVGVVEAMALDKVQVAWLPPMAYVFAHDRNGDVPGGFAVLDAKTFDVKKKFALPSAGLNNPQRYWRDQTSRVFVR